MDRPLVSDIVEQLSAEIAAAHPGDRLASEHQLMARYGATRAIVRTAIQELEDLYLVRRVRGTGTFVNRRVEYRISASTAPSFHQIVEEAGSRARTVQAGRNVVLLRGEPARQLGLVPGTEVMRLERIGYIDELPACYFQEWFHPQAVPDLATVLPVFESVSAIFRAAGYRPVRRRSVGTVDIAPIEVCARLELPEHRQTWVVDSLNVDGDTGNPLMVSRAWTRLDQVRMVFESTTA